MKLNVNQKSAILSAINGAMMEAEQGATLHHNDSNWHAKRMNEIRSFLEQLDA